MFVSNKYGEIQKELSILYQRGLKYDGEIV
jgi:hypothetical protein